ncbi:FAD-binding Berberine family protein [Quillaja saponaria]|uniref:FAD-binding Berberine family protein n=1 Tax=Quillaja saponaria TaxID=32244 RepID=A0AAD7PWB7_QUISA|nr:FAD-binding Berberine family protein [Quillaja saponaria]
MAISNFQPFLLLVLFSFSVWSSTANPVDYERNFIQCFSSHSVNSNSSVEVILAKNRSSYQSVLQASIKNPRFLNTSLPKPNLIVTPSYVYHIQAAILCSKKHSLQIRIRSGGHDYEGLSYVSNVPFIIIDLVKLRSISIDIKDESAWVESGATVGEFYYAIAKKSKIHGFPAGSCPTVGVGGHFSGGGFGTIFRRYGLAVDNIIDAHVVNVNGQILNRYLMGEDLFWAIKGGGGSSFGVIVSWKVKLVRVPPIVTVFDISKTLEQGATKVFQKWQTIADKFDQNLFLHAVMGVSSPSKNSGNKTVVVEFTALFLGAADNVMTLIQNNFKELGLQRNNCREMSWIQSVLYFASYNINAPLEVLLDRNQTLQSFKAKSDYVKVPIPETGLEGLWKLLVEEKSSLLIMTPYGGKMNEISESKTPFPHRRGSIYGIQYLVYWDSNEDSREAEKHINWMRRLYAYMEAYVSKSPRAAYLNYRDLDLGVNNADTSFAQAKIWGLKYFKHNFKRLVKVKSVVDPGNFFRNEQSIPLLPSHGRKGYKHVRRHE